MKGERVGRAVQMMDRRVYSLEEEEGYIRERNTPSISIRIASVGEEITQGITLTLTS